LFRNPNIGEIGGEIPVYLNIMDEARGKRRDFLGKNHKSVTYPNLFRCESEKGGFRSGTN